jgi:hypothetical protein
MKLKKLSDTAEMEKKRVSSSPVGLGFIEVQEAAHS